MLDLNQYLVRERVGFVKLTDLYDIFDPQTQQKVGEAREEVGWVSQLLRLVVSKKLLPTRVSVYSGLDGSFQQLEFYIKRGVALFCPSVEIFDPEGTPLGKLRSKAFTLGGAFTVFAADGQEVAQVKGDWKGWNFRFLQGENELGVVTKKWAGLGKELFTSADNYIINIHGDPSPAVSVLLLAAGLAVDTVLKEKE